jgi:O-antigen ligase
VLITGSPSAPARAGWRGRADSAAHWLLVAACAAVPLPQAFLSISTGLFLVAFLLAGDFADRWARIRNEPLARRALLLFAFMALSVLWSPAPWRPAIDSWWHYRGLLLIAFGLAAIDDPRWCRRGFIAFITAFTFALVVSYLRRFGILPLYNNGGRYAGFVGHAGFSLMLAIAAFIAFGQALQRYRAGPPVSARGPAPPIPAKPAGAVLDTTVLAWVALGVAALSNLYLVNDGRTGQVPFLILLPWVLARRMKLRGLVIGAVAAIALVGAAYFTAPVFKHRTDDIVRGLQTYEEGHTELSAEGLRLSFYRHSLGLIRAHPLLGDGAGSFIVDYHALGEREDLQGQFVTQNPHNDFLMIGVQQGLVGVALLLWMWIGQWRRAEGSGLAGVYAQALIICCVVAALFNSILLDAFESHLYALLSIVFSRRWIETSGEG